jgi:amidase
MADDLWQLDATDLARLIRTGRASAREATAACLGRLDAVNPAINAVVQQMAEEAMAAAAAADAAQARGEAMGPLHGVPVTVKVNVDQKGQATTNGVVAFRKMVAREDSPVVANLRAAGAIFIGRTNTPAFSMRLMTENAAHGRTLNPRDPAITPGGSSGGAGAAIATGIGPIAHGNDIGGSVRIPAYCCGVVGLRTGLGRIGAYSTQSPAGRPLGSQLMSTQGPLARSIRDLRLALSVMAADGGLDWRWCGAPLAGPPPRRPIRVALVPEVPGGFTHPAQAAAVRQAGRHLAAAGYAVEESLPPDIDQAIEIWHAIGSTELFAALWPQMEALGDDGGRASMSTWTRHRPARDLAGFLTALAERDALLHRWMAFLAETPLVVMPTLADLPPPQGLDTTFEGQAKVLDSIRASLVAPVLGLPGLAVPVGHHGRLRPGVQIMAARFREDLCLDAGEVIEAAEGVVRPIDPVSA